jgi:hypothetical protein
VTSGTTLPPPTSYIAARGQWSLGRILDIYWRFSEPGDHYSGCCLAGLDPNSEDFAILTPPTHTFHRWQSYGERENLQGHRTDVRSIATTMGRHERFGPDCSLLQCASFVGLSFGRVLTVNHPQGAWSSFRRNTIGQRSSPASIPEGVSDDQAQPLDLDPARYTTACPSCETNCKVPYTL